MSKDRWNRRVIEIEEETKPFPSFKQFVEFVAKEAKIACSPVTSLYTLKSNGDERVKTLKTISVKANTKTGWDEPLADDLQSQWESWLLDLQDLTSVKIQRCYLPEGFGQVQRYKLRHFSDMSVSDMSQKCHRIWRRHLPMSNQCNKTNLLCIGHGQGKSGPHEGYYCAKT